MIVGGAISRHAQERPLAPALSCDGETLTWAELEDLLQRAALMLSHAAADARTIALDLPNSPALALMFLATVRLGKEAQIFDAGWPQAMREKLLDLLRPDFVLHDTTADKTSAALAPRHLDLDGFRKFAIASGRIAVWPDVDPASLFYTGFTSGTTGVPKGYRRSHSSWIRSFEAALEAYPLDHSSCVLAPGTLTHSLHLFALAHAMHAGAHCILLRNFRPDRALSDAFTHAATHLFTVPAQSAMLASIAKHSPAVGSLRWLISSGSKWRERDRADLQKLFPNAASVEFYGTSETSFISHRRMDDGQDGGSVGRPFTGVDISTRDERNALAAHGAAGLIHVRSDMMFAGYAGGGGADFDEDGYFATQDRGYLDASGALILTGRHNRMIVTAGKNLFPEEVEAALETHPFVTQAAVFAVDDAQRGERLVAAISVSEPVSRADIAAHLKTSLPLFKIPRRYYRMRELPLGRSGKIDFGALHALYDAGALEPLA